MENFIFFAVLYTPNVIDQNITKRVIFDNWTFLRSTSFQIQVKLQKLFTDKLTPCDS